MNRSADHQRPFRGIAFALGAAALSLLFSCVTGGPGVGPQPKAAATLDEKIKLLTRQPLADKSFRFETVDDLAVVIRRLGKPGKTVERDIPNQYEPGVVDKGITLQYGSFSVSYYGTRPARGRSPCCPRMDPPS